jgi:hypothetical protein
MLLCLTGGQGFTVIPSMMVPVNRRTGVTRGRSITAPAEKVLTQVAQRQVRHRLATRP